MTARETLARELKRRRINSNMTQKQFSEKLNIAQTTLAGYETGEHMPDIEKLRSIARLLDTSTDLLIGT